MIIHNLTWCSSTIDPLNILNYCIFTGVAQDQGHLERGSVGALGRKQEAEEVYCDEENKQDI